MKENDLIFGIRAVIEAIQADKEIDKILIRRDLQSNLSRELFEVLKGRSIPVQRVPGERLDRLTRKNHQGVIAFMAAVTYQHLEDLIPFIYEQGKDPFILLLDGVTDVRNFGAIARTCECAGVDAIVIPAKGSVTVNADAIKTSAGALHSLPVCKEMQRKKHHPSHPLPASIRRKGVCSKRKSARELYRHRLQRPHRHCHGSGRYRSGNRQLADMRRND